MLRQAHLPPKDLSSKGDLQPDIKMWSELDIVPPLNAMAASLQN